MYRRSVEIPSPSNPEVELIRTSEVGCANQFEGIIPINKTVDTMTAVKIAEKFDTGSRRENWPDDDILLPRDLSQLSIISA